MDTNVIRERIGVFVSVGTGMPSPRSMESEGAVQQMTRRMGYPIHLIKALVAMATQTEQTQADIKLWFPASRKENPILYRFSMTHRVHDIKLFEYKKYPEIKEYTEEYLRTVPESLVDCAKDMADIVLDINLITAPIKEESDIAEVSELERRIAALRL